MRRSGRVVGWPAPSASAGTAAHSEDRASTESIAEAPGVGDGAQRGQGTLQEPFSSLASPHRRWNRGEPECVGLGSSILGRFGTPVAYAHSYWWGTLSVRAAQLGLDRLVLAEAEHNERSRASMESDFNTPTRRRY